MELGDVRAARIDGRMIGAAGEHFVMAELLRRGFIAALAPAGAPNMDIIVSDRDGGRMAAIQVKTTGAGANDWMMSEKHEGIRADRLFYAFVNFETLAVFVVPAAIVAKAVETSHRIWLGLPRRRGSGEKDQSSKARRFMADYGRILAGSQEEHQFVDGWLEPYRNAWSQLGLATEAAVA